MGFFLFSLNLLTTYCLVDNLLRALHLMLAGTLLIPLHVYPQMDDEQQRKMEMITRLQ